MWSDGQEEAFDMCIRWTAYSMFICQHKLLFLPYLVEIMTGLHPYIVWIQNQFSLSFDQCVLTSLFKDIQFLWYKWMCEISGLSSRTLLYCISEKVTLMPAQWWKPIKKPEDDCKSKVTPSVLSRWNENLFSFYGGSFTK